MSDDISAAQAAAQPIHRSGLMFQLFLRWGQDFHPQWFEGPRSCYKSKSRPESLQIAAGPLRDSTKDDVILQFPLHHISGLSKIDKRNFGNAICVAKKIHGINSYLFMNLCIE